MDLTITFARRQGCMDCKPSENGNSLSSRSLLKSQTNVHYKKLTQEEKNEI
jgi:hypothetical protein